MQRIPVSLLKPGMATARNIYNGDGRKLLSAGVRMTDSFIRRLAELKVPAAYITNPYMEGIEVAPIILEEVRTEMVQQVKRFFSLLNSPRPEFLYREMQAMGKKIVTEVRKNRGALLQFNEVWTAENYYFDHAVNVCITAVLIATRLNYTEERLRDLAMGSLMRDAGQSAIGSEILNKPGNLSSEELAMMKKHSRIGFDLLRKSGRKSGIGFSAPAMLVAFQHHEKFDGTGYPRGLKNAEIHEYARIVAMAEVYDAVISDRPYRSAKFPHEAYKLLQDSAGCHFDPDLLPFFLDKIALYPVGTLVKLNNGAVGIVVGVHQGMTTYPTVRLLLDEHARAFPDGVDLDLREYRSISIAQVVYDKTVFDLMGKRPG